MLPSCSKQQRRRPNIASESTVIVGRIAGIYGIKGWVKVFSETQPRENILSYNPWLIRVGGEWQPRRVTAGRVHGKGIVAHIEGYDDPDQARVLLQCEVAIQRSQMPKLKQGEYYWSDLQGLAVTNLQGEPLGTVDYLFETGANDVMVLKGERERLLPYVMGVVVKEVDLAAGTMRVDWPAEDD